MCPLARLRTCSSPMKLPSRSPNARHWSLPVHIFSVRSSLVQSSAHFTTAGNLFPVTAAVLASATPCSAFFYEKVPTNLLDPQRVCPPSGSQSCVEHEAESSKPDSQHALQSCLDEPCMEKHYVYSTVVDTRYYDDVVR